MGFCTDATHTDLSAPARTNSGSAGWSVPGQSQAERQPGCWVCVSRGRVKLGRDSNGREILHSESQVKEDQGWWHWETLCGKWVLVGLEPFGVSLGPWCIAWPRCASRMPERSQGGLACHALSCCVAGTS